MLHSIRIKVLLAIISITLLTASAITLVFYFKSSEMIEENYAKNLYGRLEQTGKTFDEDVKEIYYITAQSSGEEELIETIQQFGQSKDEKILEEMAGLLRNYKRRYSEIGSVYLLLPKEQIIVTSSDYPVYKKGISSSKYEAVEDCAEKKSGPLIMDDPLRENVKFLSFPEKIEDGNGTILGYLMTNMEERNIYYKYLDNYYDSSSTQVILLDQENQIVSSKNADRMGELYDNKGFSQIEENGIYSSKDPELMGVGVQTVFSGCRFFVTVEKHEILRDLNQIKYFLTGFLLLFLGLALIPAYFITRAMYKPIKNLTKTMDAIGEGKLENRVQITSKDEIGHLSQNFNTMVDHIEELIEQLVKEESLKKDAELEALQYQITPHFMYNTLNSIKFAALLKGEKELGALLGDFVELLQASINKKGTFMTVADEIHILQNYIHLQDFRYEGHLDVQYEIEREASGCMLPRLLLQPMVENAILHGLDMKESKNQIIIKARVEDDVLCLSVSDNGRGMTQEQIIELTTSKAKKVSGLSGIGVANVRERLKLYYGKKAGISYESNEEGTTAYLFLPAYGEVDKYFY